MADYDEGDDNTGDETEDGANEEPRELTKADRKKLASLDEAIEKFETQKRWSDMIRSILKKANIVVDADDKVALLRQAASLYLERSSNQAEAIKCFERLLKHAPHDEEAITQLKQIYEKRRDWEKLVRTMQREVELLPEDDRLLHYAEMAELATQRLRKPAICIELWQKVLDEDPDNPNALEHLTQLYERSREWEPLAGVLEKLIQSTTEPAAMKQQLQKLGMIYADKVGDDQGAIRAFKQLLELDPEDRRAQEQLKRRYVALGAWDDLEQFYAANERWDELIRIVERQADAEDMSEEDKLALLFRSARLWETKKEKPERAARVYEKVLAIDAENLQAAEALTPIYENARDARKLVSVLQIRLKRTRKKEKRVDLLRQIGLIYEERLRQPQEAFDTYIEAFHLIPSLEEARLDAERVADEIDGWDRLVDGYEAALEQADDEQAAIAVRLSYGQTLGRLERFAEAIDQYETVYLTDSTNMRVLEGLADLYFKTERFNDLSDIYKRQLELETEPERRLKISVRQAGLLHEGLQRPDEAITAYEQIVAEHGVEVVEAVRALDQLYEGKERWDDLAQLLERRLETAPESQEELAALKFRLGRLCEERLGQQRRAVDLYRETLMLMSEHDGAREGLEGLLAHDEVADDAAQILEPLHETASDWESLIRALRARSRVSADAEQRVAFLTRIADLYEYQLEDHDRSFRVLGEALQAMPSNHAIQERLELIAAEQNKFPALATVLSELAQSADDPSAGRALWLKAATIYDEQLQDADSATIAYQSMLESDPTDATALGALEQLYRRGDRWQELTTILRKRADATDDPEQRAAVLGDMGSVYKNQLNDPDEAIVIQHEILEVEPHSREALLALDQLLEGQQKWSDLADNLERQLALADDAGSQVALMLRLAQLRQRELDAPEAAIQMYRDVLEKDASNPAALEALEGFLQSEDHQAHVAELLEPVYRDSQAFSKVVQVLEVQAARSSSQERSVELLHRMADVQEHSLSDPRGAFETYMRAFKQDPSNSVSSQSLQRLAHATGEIQSLVDVYEGLIESIDDPDFAVEVHLKVAELHETDLGNVEHAISHYERARALNEGHPGAVNALERLYQQAERYEDLASLYLAKAAMLGDPEERKVQLFKAGALYEDILERPDDAVAVYQQVLELDPADVDAIDKLIDLYRRARKFEPLLETYLLKTEVVTGFEEKKDLLMQVGQVYEADLQDVDKATDTYGRILEIDPEDGPALGRLESLYRGGEQWHELLGILERKAELASSPDEQVAIRFHIADLWRERLGEPMHAIEIYREIVAQAPNHQPTLDSLRQMTEQGVEPQAAAAVLHTVYESDGNFEQLAALREAEVRHVDDHDQKVRMLHELANLYERDLGDPDRAFASYAKAVELQPLEEKTLDSLESLAQQTQRWEEVTTLYHSQVERHSEDSPEVVGELALRAAMIFEVHLEDPATAISHYQKVIEVDGLNSRAIEALDRLYESSERWGDLAEILKKEVAIASTPDEILNLQFRTGQIYQHQLHRFDSAIEQYREILAAAPEYAPAVSALEGLFSEGVEPMQIGEVLEPLYRIQGDWDRLLNVQEVQIQHQQDPFERVTMMHRLAELAEEKATDHVRAFAWMQKALLEDPSHDHSLSEAERLSGIVGGWSDLASTYANGIADTPDTLNKVELGRRLARVYEEELHDIERAEETYRFVLGVDEGDDDALQALDRIYGEHGAHEALAQVLRKRLAATTDQDKLVGLHFRLGQLLETQLAQPEAAIELYQRLLSQHDSDHLDGIRALQGVYSRLERWPELLSAMEQELHAVMGDSQRAQVLSRMARLASDRLLDPERALGLWKHVLDLRGEDPEALNALGDIYSTQGNWRELVDVLEREAAAVTDDQVRIQIYADLARIWYDQLENERKAVENWERVLDLDSVNVHALFNMAEIHRAAGNSREQADVLHRIIETGAATLDDSDLVTAYLRLGNVYADELEQPIDAIESYTNATMLDPSNAEVLGRLETVYRAEAMWEQAIHVMEKRAQLLPTPEERVAQLVAVTEIWTEQLDNPQGAVGAFQRILEADPLHGAAFEHLEGVYLEGEQWEDIIELYVIRVEASEDAEERVTLLHKTADTYLTQLNDSEQAFHTLCIAWSEDFTNKITVEQLEQVAQDNDYWNELLAEANQFLEQVQDSEARIAICLHCAKWYGQNLGHSEYAIPYYEQVRAIDPTNAQAWWQLGDLYETTKQWDKLAQVLAKLVELTNDPVVKANTFVRMGDLAEDRYARRQQAEDYYRSALDLQSGHLQALDALERMYREDGKSNKLLNILERRAEVVDDPESIVEARLLVAEAYETRVEDFKAATENYQEVLNIDGSNLPAMKGLARVYEQQERYQELLEILERQYSELSTERERIEVLSKLAKLWEEEFRKPETAIQRLEELLDIDPLHTDALIRLERLYRQLQQWDDLVRTYERHANAAPEREERIRIFRGLGDVYANEVNDIDNAIESYLRVTSLDEDDIEALKELTRLYEKKGDHAQALEMMDELAKRAQEPSEQVELYFHMGRVMDQEIGDRIAALDHFQRAIDVDPGHLGSLGAMRAIYVDTADWTAAARTLEREIDNTEVPRQKAACLVELGHILSERLDEEAAAIEAFEEAYKHDPNNEDAALPLVDAYTTSERYQEAVPLLQTLVHKSDRREKAEQHRLASLLGEAATKIGDSEEAVRAFQRAHQLDGRDIAALRGLASSHFEAKDWEHAFKHYQMLLVQHRDTLGRDETTDVYYRLGMIKRQQGEPRKARNMFDKALEEDPHFIPAITALIEIHEAEEDWREVVQCKKRIVDVTDKDSARVKALEEVGDLWSEKLDQPDEAAAAYMEATDLDPRNHIILHKLLSVYQKSGRWSDAVEIVERISELDERPAARAKYAYTMGVILRDELSDEEGALERFNQALDFDLSQLKPFEAINKILNKRKDWKQLERAFRKMLHRVIGQGNADLEHNLWHNLGIVYRDRQRNFESAAEAFKMAVAAKPEIENGHQILAELYTTMPDRTQDAIVEHQWLLRHDPNRLASYRALYKLYFDVRAHDKAWCVARTLTYLNEADKEQQQFYAQYKRDEATRPKTRVSSDLWASDLTDPDQDRVITRIMELLAPAVHQAKAVPDKALKAIHRRKPEDLDNSTALFTRTFTFVLDVLNISIPPRLYLISNTPGGITDLPGSSPTPAIVVGSTLAKPSASGLQPKDLEFEIGRHLSYYRPERFILTQIKSHTEFKTLLLAAMRMVGMPSQDPAADAAAAQLAKHMTQAQRDALKQAVRLFVDGGGAADIKVWMRAMESTALRAGLLVCNDLDVAIRMAQERKSDTTVEIDNRDKIKAIVLFSVSEEYFRLREALGLQIQV